LQSKGKYRLLIYDNAVNILREKMNRIKKYTGLLTEASKKGGLEEKTEYIKYVGVHYHQNVVNIRIYYLLIYHYKMWKSSEKSKLHS
jgi:hypothetical protein